MPLLVVRVLTIWTKCGVVPLLDELEVLEVYLADLRSIELTYELFGHIRALVLK